MWGRWRRCEREPPCSFPPLSGLRLAKAPTSRGRIHFSRGLWVRKHVLLGVCKIHCSLLQGILQDAESVKHIPAEGAGSSWFRHKVRCCRTLLKKATRGCRTAQWCVHRKGGIVPSMVRQFLVTDMCKTPRTSCKWHGGHLCTSTSVALFSSIILMASWSFPYWRVSL